jgi:hypothetical protein
MLVYQRVWSCHFPSKWDDDTDGFSSSSAGLNSRKGMDGLVLPRLTRWFVGPAAVHPKFTDLQCKSCPPPKEGLHFWCIHSLARCVTWSPPFVWMWTHVVARQDIFHPPSWMRENWTQNGIPIASLQEIRLQVVDLHHVSSCTSCR